MPNLEGRIEEEHHLSTPFAVNVFYFYVVPTHRIVLANGRKTFCKCDVAAMSENDLLKAGRARHNRRQTDKLETIY